MDRTPEEIRELRESAAKSAACCADCFRPLGAADSVTMVTRLVHIPEKTIPGWITIKAHDDWLREPICILCSLMTSAQFAFRGYAPKMACVLEWSTNRLRRLRCEGCGRPMRVLRPSWYSIRIPMTERCCCKDCLKAAEMHRDRERHRVAHEPATCVVCGETFTPKRNDAVTCGNRCRQARFREARRGVTAAAAAAPAGRRKSPNSRIQSGPDG